MVMTSQLSLLPNFMNINKLKPLHKTPSRFIVTNSQRKQQPADDQCPSSLFPPANQSVAAIVFGDGSKSRLYPLTKRRSEGAIPIAGNYRLIDGVVSNCINSNITKVYALTQFNSTSLNSHLSRAYSGARLAHDGFVEVIAAYQSTEDDGWFQGTADAVRRCLWVLEEYPVTEFVILPGHHLYKMDYRKLVQSHRDNKAQITVAVLSKRTSQHIIHDPGFGIFKLNLHNNQVIEHEDKAVEVQDYNDIIDEEHFPSMGIYVINRDVMIKLLKEYFPKANDLTSEVIPGAISLGMKVHGYQFDGYWEDMRNIEAFYRANMESTKKTNMAYNFYDRDYPLYTLPRHLPPTLITDAVITNCVIGDGCILNRCNIKGTVVGLRTRIADGAIIEDSVIMGSDIYQSIGDEEAKGRGTPIGIGEGSQIRNAIVDKNARIGKNVMIINKDNVQEGNREAYGYIITSGIIVILKGATIPDGNIL
ncbi:hypothetical protein LguiB_026827 [Lonicera macranthoides]